MYMESGIIIIFMEFGGSATQVRESVQQRTTVVSVAVRWIQLLVWCWPSAGIARRMSRMALPGIIDLFIRAPFVIVRFVADNL
jgi:hypothetical protein